MGGVSLKQRILAVLREHAPVPTDEMRRWLSEVDRILLDTTLESMEREGAVVRKGLRYSLPVTPSRRVPSAEEEAAASLNAKFPVGRVNGTEVLKVGHQTVNLASTPLTAGSIPAGSTSLAFDNATSRRQAALNRIQLLQVELANEQAVVERCEQFFRLHEEFAQVGEG